MTGERPFSTLTNLRASAMLQLAGLSVFGAYGSVMMKDAGLAEARIGQLLALENCLMMVGAILWGQIADRFNCHRLCIACGTLGAVGTLIWFAQCETEADFLVYTLGRGVFSPSIMGLMSGLAIGNLSSKGQGASFGGYRRFGSLGYLSATMIIPQFVDGVPMLARLAAIYLPLSIFFIWQLKDPKSNDAPAKNADTPRSPLFTRPVVLFLLAHFFVCATDPGTLSFINAYARELGGSVQLVGVLTGVNGLMALLMLPFMGRMNDRYGARLVLIIAFVSQGLRMLATSFISDPDWLWLAHLLHGLGWAGREVATQVYVAGLLGAGRLGTASSVIASIRMAGWLVGSLTMGWLAEIYGYPFMFRASVGFAVLGLVFLIPSFRGRR